MAPRLDPRADPMRGEPEEPAILGRPPSLVVNIEDGAVYPAAAVRELVTAAEARGYRRGWDAAWADARRTFDRKRGELITRVACEAAAMLREKGESE